MSLLEIKLCSLLLKDDFGDTIESVCIMLLKKSWTPSGIIAQQLHIRLAEVKKTLCVLIQHNLVEFQHNTRGFVEYSAILKNILARVRFPNYVFAARTLYGDSAELIIEELLRHGQMQLTVVVTRVYERLVEALQESEATLLNLFDIRDKFISLVHTQFLQRCAGLENKTDESTTVVAVPKFQEQSEEDMYIVPKVDMEEPSSRKRKQSTENTEQPNKRTKIDSEAADAGIYWKVNYDRFDRYLRDQALIEAVTNKVDVCAGEIFRAILRLSELTTDSGAPTTNPLSYNEIFQELPSALNLSRTMVDQYLKILVEDSIQFIHKVGDSGGGMYSINFRKSFTTLSQSHIQSFIQEKFGSKSLRIYRLLIMKKQLEQKQIEEFAMVPAKEAKELLYTMFDQQLVNLTEIPRTPDHAPSRTFFLFSVDVRQVARMLLEHCYKSMYNLITKRNQELAEHKRLLEKHARMEAIISSLEGADETQKQDIEEMITPAERGQVAKVKGSTKKMEQAELQLDDTIFIYKMYLYYIHMPT